MLLSRREILATLPRPQPLLGGFWLHVHRRAMACRFDVAVSADDARAATVARAALDEVSRMEDRLSVFRPASEVSRLNRDLARGAVPASDDLFDLLALSSEIFEATEGAFDVTTTPLVREWGWLDRRGRPPAREALATAKARVGMNRIVLDTERREVASAWPACELSFGGVGKGFALDRAAALLRSRGVRQALLSAGGSSHLALGGGQDGVWRVRLADTCHPGQSEVTFRLVDCALGVSAATEQWFEADGRRLGHVLDPRTGRPAEGMTLTAVVADDAAQADALATAFFVGGRALAERFCASHQNTLALLVEAGPSGPPAVVGAHPRCTLEWSHDG